MADSTQFGAFIPTTDDFDVEEIRNSNMPSQLKDLALRLYQSYNDAALITNIKDSGYYLPVEFVNGQQWFADPSIDPQAPDTQTPTTRQVYRMVVDFGTLPNTGTKTVPHTIEGISTQTTFTRIYATASDTTNMEYIPIPYVSSTETIEINIDDTDVIITTSADFSNFDTTYVVLEYLKN